MSEQEKDEGFSGELLSNHGRKMKMAEKEKKEQVVEPVPAQPKPDDVGRRHTSFVDDSW